MHAPLLRLCPIMYCHSINSFCDWYHFIHDLITSMCSGLYTITTAALYSGVVFCPHWAEPKILVILVWFSCLQLLCRCVTHLSSVIFISQNFRYPLYCDISDEAYHNLPQYCRARSALRTLTHTIVDARKLYQSWMIPNFPGPPRSWYTTYDTLLLLDSASHEIENQPGDKTDIILSVFLLPFSVDSSYSFHT